MHRSTRSTRRTRLAAAAVVAAATAAVLPGTAVAAAGPAPAGSVAEHCAPGPDGTGPTCSFDVPPGAYDVRVTLGSRTAAADTGIDAEANRTVLAPVATRAGHLDHRTLTIDVRTPESMPDGQEGDGTPGLQLRLTGTAPALAAVTVVPRPDGPRLFVISDSTASDWLNTVQRGWAQELPQYFRGGIDVANWAVSGSSSGSWLGNPRLFATLAPQLRPGDEVFIQLAHNDKDTTEADYRANYAALIDGVRAQGAKPVLVTPPVRHLFGTDGKITATGRIVNGLGVDLPAVMRDIARQDRLPLLDLTADSEALMERLGPDASFPLYADLPAGRSQTHFNEGGATTIAGLVAREIAGAHLPAAGFLRDRPAASGE
ncbi:Lysophospholipase L1 [Actinacidiphila yanglinensis]|uniref:Lysophospholipase L1 n=1 Tax=Actinacidiphila yanglinensis TaxID=310779 RepID=A0A1H6D898_9ACTN|nr:GDSL-type esterase/lipase family protein [Actinacidiphila yanglinensis]SEG81103.1 Lysophospholipase L1 [Actinacidiphila yanglinensis]